MIGPSERRTETVIGSCLMGLLLSACATGGKAHQENVNAAVERLQAQRARLMLPVALQQFESGDLDQATRTLGEALAADPQNAEFYLLAGRIELEKARLERAYRLFERAIEFRPELAPTHYFKGIVLQRWRRLDDALAAYERAFELERDHVPYFTAVLEMLVAVDRLDDAVTMVESKLDYFEHSAGVHATAGQLYLLKQDLPRAIRLLHDAHLLSPDDLQIREELAMIELSAEHYDQAIRHFEALRASAEYADRTDVTHALAEAYLVADRPDRARALYLELTRRGRDDADAWLKLGQVALAEGDYGSAVSAARQAIRISPKRAEGYQLAGLVWQKRRQPHRALPLFDKAEQLSRPDEATSVMLRGLALQSMGHHDAAVLAYHEALRRQPDHAQAARLLEALGEVGN